MYFHDDEDDEDEEEEESGSGNIVHCVLIVSNAVDNKKQDDTSIVEFLGHCATATAKFSLAPMLPPVSSKIDTSLGMWMYDNWGSCSDARGVVVLQSPTSYHVHFQVQASAPNKWLTRIAKDSRVPNGLEFTLHWMDEGVTHWCGTMTVRLSGTKVDQQSGASWTHKERYEFAKEWFFDDSLADQVLEEEEDDEDEEYSQTVWPQSVESVSIKVSLPSSPNKNDLLSNPQSIFIPVNRKRKSTEQESSSDIIHSESPSKKLCT